MPRVSYHTPPPFSHGTPSVEVGLSRHTSDSCFANMLRGNAQILELPLHIKKVICRGGKEEDGGTKQREIEDLAEDSCCCYLTALSRTTSELTAGGVFEQSSCNGFLSKPNNSFCILRIN